MISPRRELDKRLTSGAGYMVGFTGITEGKTMNKLPCPLHADCELYLREEDCGFRNGQITYEQAEDLAYHRGGLSACTEWADNE